MKLITKIVIATFAVTSPIMASAQNSVNQGFLVESANNHAILANIRNTARAGTTVPQELFTDALQVALGSPIFYRKAKHSLIRTR